MKWVQQGPTEGGGDARRGQQLAELAAKVKDLFSSGF